MEEIVDYDKEPLLPQSTVSFCWGRGIWFRSTKWMGLRRRYDLKNEVLMADWAECMSLPAIRARF